MVITSTENSKITLAAKLGDKKFRRSSGLYLIEGERLVRDAIKHGADLQEIFVKESAADKFSFNATVVADKVFAKMSDTVHSQGVLAVVRQPVPKGQVQGNCLVLDGLQDPGNVGTLIRTAAACGFSDVFAANCVDVFSPKVVRAAMSAHFCVNLWRCDTAEEAFAQLPNHILLAADMGGANVFQENFSGKIALILGNEGNGLSEISLRRATQLVSLPMQNNFESLNVAIAGSVIMYKIFADQNK